MLKLGEEASQETYKHKNIKRNTKRLVLFTSGSPKCKTRIGLECMKMKQPQDSYKKHANKSNLLHEKQLRNKE